MPCGAYGLFKHAVSYGVDAPTASMCHDSDVVIRYGGRPSVEETSISRLDFAKHVFRFMWPGRMTRSFFASLPKGVVAMEACASAHHWGRENDASDAEAASRATMRFVPKGRQSPQEDYRVPVHRDSEAARSY